MFYVRRNPNKPASSALQMLNWPKYNMSSQKYLIFDKQDAVGGYLFAKEVDFWRNTLPSVIKAVDRSCLISAITSGIH